MGLRGSKQAGPGAGGGGGGGGGASGGGGGRLGLIGGKGRSRSRSRSRSPASSTFRNNNTASPPTSQIPTAATRLNSFPDLNDQVMRGFVGGVEDGVIDVLNVEVQAKEEGPNGPAYVPVARGVVCHSVSKVHTLLWPSACPVRACRPSVCTRSLLPARFSCAGRGHEAHERHGQDVPRQSLDEVSQGHQRYGAQSFDSMAFLAGDRDQSPT